MKSEEEKADLKQRMRDEIERMRNAIKNSKPYDSVKPEDIDTAIEGLKVVKNFVAKNQDYELGAIIRDIEKFFLDLK